MEMSLYVRELLCLWLWESGKCRRKRNVDEKLMNGLHEFKWIQEKT